MQTKDTRELPAETEKKTGRFSFLAEAYLLFLTFLIPLKFGTLIGVPELPMTYWDSAIGIFAASWPVLLFPVFAGFGLMLSLLFARSRFRNPAGTLFGILWILFAVVCLPGIIHATTWDFYEHNVIYAFGCTAYALSLMNVLDGNPRFGKWLAGVMTASFLLSLYSAFYQYTAGFEDMLKYYEKRKAESGGQFYYDRFGRKLAEFRVSADFSSGNAYAGYLLLMFPILLSLLCIAGNRVTPPLPAQLLLMLPTTGVFLFLLRQTKSRGCFLALIAGIAVTVCAFRFRKKILMMICGLFGCALAGFCLLIALDRGPKSIMFRLDYFRSAFRMMMDYPLFGAGWGEFFHNYFIYKTLINDEAPHTPHNFPLTIGSQNGLLSFLIASALILLPLVTAFLLLKKQNAVSGKDPKTRENTIWKTGLLIGFASWFFHSLCDIDYETPGSFCSAAAIAFLIFSQTDSDSPVPRFRKKAEGWLRNRKTKTVLLLFFCLSSFGILGWICWKAPVLITGEMAFDRLFTAVNPHFGRQGAAMAQPEEAQKLFAEAVRLLPRSPFPWDITSHYVAALGPRYAEEAIAMVAEASRRSPRRASYYFRQYMAYRKLGQKEKAETFRQKAFECSPKNPDYFKENQLSDEKFMKLDTLW